MKVIAFYLPQFYEFKENNEWWGKGFTEWTNVKKSKPLYKNHYQPTIPLDERYYCLQDIDTLKWQIDTAKKYGIYGFCFYHYWFGAGRKLMEVPIEIYRDNKELDFPYCLSWANHNWSKTWIGGDKEILMDMRYGGEDEWIEHLEYLMTFFKDERYIKIDGKPVLLIYLPQEIPNLESMIEFYDVYVKQNGFDGITFISQCMLPSNSCIEYMDYCVRYEPNVSMMHLKNTPKALLKAYRVAPKIVMDRLKHGLRKTINKLTKGKVPKLLNVYSYDATWQYILKRPVESQKEITGAFVSFDASPRRQARAIIYRGATPAKFAKYMAALLNKEKAEFKKDILFLSAWNEWGEGMYMEPDEKNKYGYLEALKHALEMTNVSKNIRNNDAQDM